MIIQQEGGVTIVCEHRFYGLSNPYPNFSVQSFSVHMSTLVSRLVKPIYEQIGISTPRPERLIHSHLQRQFQYMFPGAFIAPLTPDVLAANIKYRGWSVNSERLFFTNGNRA